MSGWVYVLHFERPYARDSRGAVRHYVGFSAISPAHRLENHTSPLVRAAKAAGIHIVIGSQFAGTRGDERRVKRQRHPERFCNVCKAAATHSTRHE